MKNIIYRIEFDLIELMESRSQERRPYTGDRRPETGDRKRKIGARSGGRSTVRAAGTPLSDIGDRKW